MPEKPDPLQLMHRVSHVAARTPEWFVPRPLRTVMDRTLVDVACVASGGMGPVASDLRVDVPAVDAWRSVGVPAEFRPRLTAIVMRPNFRRAA